MQATTEGYQTEEAKHTGAQPDVYLAIMRTSRSIVSADYSAGAHTNTEFVDSNLQLQAGQASGNWASAVIDSAHLTPNVIFDKITWTQTLNGGTVTVQIRTATTSGGVSSASYVTYTNATLNHTARYRYYQVKISLTKVTSTPTISSVVIRHKALIPKNSYKNLGTINYGVDIDFTQAFTGDLSFEVDNKSNPWDKHQSSSYIYNIDYYFELIEVWAGFVVSGTTEWLQQYVGEMLDITTDSGNGASYNATISSRDYLYRKLMNTIIGRPSSAGTPQPYMAGKRYRVPCKETDTTNFIYSFYCQQSVTSIDAVYVRDTTGQKWVTAPSNSTNTTTKTVDFAADPQSEVAVDITVDTDTHPIDIMKDILDNELSLGSDYYDSTVLDTVKDRTSGLEVGCSFDNISVYDAFSALAKALDAVSYIEGGLFKCKNYWPEITSTQSFGEDAHRHIVMKDSIAEVQNKIGVFYGDYDDNKTDYLEVKDQDSIDDYGELTKDNFSFKYNDPVSITAIIALEEIVGHWLFRQNYQYEYFNIDLRMEILRAEIFDVIELTTTKHNLTSAKMFLLTENISMTDFNGTIEAIRYPEINWAFASDNGDTEDLYYMVDDAESDLAYQSYAW